MVPDRAQAPREPQSRAMPSSDRRETQAEDCLLGMSAAAVRRAVVICLLAVFALMLFDIWTRHQKTLKPSAELDLYFFGVHAPAQHSDEFRPKGYINAVHHTTLRLFKDSLVACRVFNLIVYSVTSVVAVRVLWRSASVLAALALAMASPRMLESAVSAASDFAAVCGVFLVWILGFAYASAVEHRGRSLALLALAILVAIWSCSLRIQNALVLLSTAAAAGIAMRFGRLPVSIGRFLLWVSASCVVSVVWLAPKGNWKNVAIAVIARWENRVWPDVGRIFWDPSFPQAPQDFFALDGAWMGVLNNWLFNVQHGVIRHLFVWSAELLEFRYPPVLSLVLLASLLLVARRLRALSSIRAADRVRLDVFVVLFAGHCMSYLALCGAFLTDRFVLHALPICVFFLVSYLCLEVRAAARRLVFGIGVACFLISIVDFGRAYRESLNPYAATYVQLDQLQLPGWSEHERDRLRGTPCYAHLLARPLIDPLVQIRLDKRDMSKSYDYDLTFFYIPPRGLDVPERSRLFLPREAALDPSAYVLRFVKNGASVLDVPLTSSILKRL